MAKAIPIPLPKVLLPHIKPFALAIWSALRLSAARASTEISETATKALCAVNKQMSKKLTSDTSINTKGITANIIATWLIKIQNLLLPKRFKVNESIIGPKNIFRVQGIIVIDNNNEISLTEAPIETR